MLIRMDYCALKYINCAGMHNRTVLKALQSLLPPCYDADSSVHAVIDINPFKPYTLYFIHEVSVPKDFDQTLMVRGMAWIFQSHVT